MSEVNLTKNQKSRIQRAIKSLNDVAKELQQENQDNDINWYLDDNDNLHLMGHSSHSGNNSAANYDAVIATFNLERASGGGW